MIPFLAKKTAGSFQESKSDLKAHIHNIKKYWFLSELLMISRVQKGRKLAENILLYMGSINM